MFLARNLAIYGACNNVCIGSLNDTNLPFFIETLRQVSTVLLIWSAKSISMEFFSQLIAVDRPGKTFAKQGRKYLLCLPFFVFVRGLNERSDAMLFRHLP